MPAYLTSYKRYSDSPISTNLVWADEYKQVQDEFSSCDWFAAEIAPEYRIKEVRAKGMPERWLI